MRLHGKLSMGVSNLLHARVKKLIPEHKRIVLDLSDLSHMDSSGLGTLVGLFVSARSAGCSLELVNLSHGIQKVLSLTNLLVGVHGDWGERHQDGLIGVPLLPTLDKLFIMRRFVPSDPS